MSADENHRILSELFAAQNAGQAVVLATIVKARGSVPRRTGTKMLIYENGRFSGTVGGGQMEALVIQEAHHVFQDGQPRTLPFSLVEPARGDPGVCGGEVEIYLEPYLPPMTVYVIGCGHVGRAVAECAHWLGFYVVATDDRPEWATPEHMPHAQRHLPGSLAEAIRQHPITAQTYVVVVTRNVLIDRAILPLLVSTPAPYVGIIGSKRRWAETKKLLLVDGLTERDLQKFHSPIGLELNAETPEEIALSILAEIVMLRRQGTGERMKSA